MVIIGRKTVMNSSKIRRRRLSEALATRWPGEATEER
jgi:hypothetical protein